MREPTGQGLNPALLPFQSAFVERLGRGLVDGEAIALCAPAGTGKTTTAALGVAALTQAPRDQRVLILAETQFAAEQWVEVVRSVGGAAATPVRTALRVLRNELAHGVKLPVGVVVMTARTACEGHGAEFVAMVAWDLVVIDRVRPWSTPLGGSPDKLFTLPPTKSTLLLVESAESFEEAMRHGLVKANATIIDWSAAIARIRQSASRRSLRTVCVDYERSAPELRLLRAVHASASGLQGEVLGTLAASSTAALESGLYRRIERAESGAATLTLNERYSAESMLRMIDDVVADADTTFLRTASGSLLMRP